MAMVLYAGTTTVPDDRDGGDGAAGHDDGREAVGVGRGGTIASLLPAGLLLLIRAYYAASPVPRDLP